MHRLPGDAGERHLADKMANEDPAALVQGSHPVVGVCRHNGRRGDSFPLPLRGRADGRPVRLRMPIRRGAARPQIHVGLPALGFGMLGKEP